MKNRVLCKGYSKEFKTEAVRLVLEKKQSSRAVKRELGLGKRIIYRWVKEYRDDQQNTFPGKGNFRADEEEIRTDRFSVTGLRRILSDQFHIFSTACPELCITGMP